MLFPKQVPGRKKKILPIWLGAAVLWLLFHTAVYVWVGSLIMPASSKLLQFMVGGMIAPAAVIAVDYIGIPVYRKVFKPFNEWWVWLTLELFL